MTIDELRDTLGRLLELLKSADAKAATVKGLAEFIELTEGFGELQLKAFVKLAEAGRNPPAQKATGAKGAKPKADASAVAREVADLYARAADPAVTEEQIRAACGQLDALKKDDALKVAAAVGLEGMKAKSKGDIASAITNRLLDRKAAAIRSQLINRPAGVTSTTPE